MDQAPDVMLFKDWINLTAIVVGPILAVIATRVVDHFRESKARKTKIFETLMTTRTNKLGVDHIGALNALEIVFSKRTKVLHAWKDYLENLSTDISTMTEASKSQHYTKRDRLFAKLVAEIARSLRIDVEQIDILNENYFPHGWFEIDADQRMIRKGMIALLNGNICLPVHVDKSPFLEAVYKEMREKYENNNKTKAVPHDQAN